MQQFTVPQFIDVEDKIFGPLTIRQFLIMLGAFVIVAISYKLFTFFTFMVILILVFFLSGLLAFFRVNGMPMHFFILNFLETGKKPLLRVWNNSYHMDQSEEEEEVDQHIEEVQKKNVYTTSRLNELSMVVDTSGSYSGEDDIEEKEIRRIDI